MQQLKRLVPRNWELGEVKYLGGIPPSLSKLGNVNGLWKNPYLPTITHIPFSLSLQGAGSSVSFNLYPSAVGDITIVLPLSSNVNKNTNICCCCSFPFCHFVAWG